MANKQHVALVKQGAAAIAAWRRRHPGVWLDLVGADLRGAALSRAALSRADLVVANLSRADLSGADLSRAALSRADLSGADLSGADLVGANLSFANLVGAALSGAALSGANLSGAKCDLTVFADSNLSQCLGLEEVVHEGPSSIGIDTIMRSKGQIPLAFLRGAGVPEKLIEQLPHILAEVKYCSAFIGYGEPDKAFAERLTNDLRGRGVRCWVYFLDSTPGEKTWREIGQKRREADKMVVLCSAPALVRDGILKEIEEQIDEDPDKMVPVSLDNLWKADGFRVMRGSRDLKPFLKEPNYADFSDPSSYEGALKRLLKGLERKP